MSMKKGRTAAGASVFELMAKSPKGRRPGRSLIEHTRDVIEAFEALFGTPDQPTELATCWARFFRLDDLRSFLVNGLAAAECHDWGKANDGFQAMLLRNGVQ